ncbi:MAG: hypothetical protein RIR79_1673 [Pseudomonadota bacterium]|jgi:hypothetical protein
MILNKKAFFIPLVGALTSTLIFAQTVPWISNTINSEEYSEDSLQARREKVEQRRKALLEASSKKPEVAGVESPKLKPPAVTVEGEKIPAPVTAKPVIPVPPSVQEMPKPSPAETSETVKVPSGANSVLKPPAEVSEAKTPTLQPVAETKKPEIKEVLKVQQPEQVKPLPKSDAVVPTTQEIPKPSLEAPEVKALITPK